MNELPVAAAAAVLLPLPLLLLLISDYHQTTLNGPKDKQKGIKGTADHPL